MKLDAHKFALASALTSALFMILLSLGGGVGMYRNAMTQMQSMHMWYAPTFGGTITGLIEAAVVTYIFVWVAVSIYNALVVKK
ncbi:MAG: hypothetical protein UY95_C0021G0004 [Parcubacteria group bacterium GW2011_GWA2_56_7]|nr:MAG: hypothetical protein UY95_C0021G0004 [Parcubacteria group bacterium GW2011_GWA2_56_7]